MTDGHTVQIAMFLIAQSLILIGVIVGAYVKIVVSVERIRADNNQNHAESLTKFNHLDVVTKSLKDDHGGLANKVDGISRAVAKLEGEVHALHLRRFRVREEDTG